MNGNRLATSPCSPTCGSGETRRAWPIARAAASLEHAQIHVLLRVRLEIGDERTQIDDERVAATVQRRIVHEQADRALSGIDLEHDRVGSREHRLEPPLRARELT